MAFHYQIMGPWNFKWYEWWFSSQLYYFPWSCITLRNHQSVAFFALPHLFSLLGINSKCLHWVFYQWSLDEVVFQSCHWSVKRNLSASAKMNSLSELWSKDGCVQKYCHHNGSRFFFSFFEIKEHIKYVIKYNIYNIK